MVPSSRVQDHVSLHLDNKLTHLSHRHCECNIYKVYDRLRRQNEKAYEPEILAIGPYHHHKANTRMEEHKLWNLQQLLKRRNETSVIGTSSYERFARKSTGCYALRSLNEDEFVVMMLLDLLLSLSYFANSPSQHVLDLAYLVTSHSFAKLLAERNYGKKKKRWEFIHCATELHEAGIRFKKANHSTPLLDIKFENGTLQIPQFPVEEKTECLFRNIIAHEQHLQDSNPKYVMDYLTFMLCLINSSKDVSLLRRNGIINNMLGDDEAICAMFTKASTCVFVSRDGFCYSEVFNDINEHCRRRWNIWTAKLRHNYFNSPWTIISFLGAVVLLLLTLTQTVLPCFLSFINPFFHKC
ncbi:UPF0481 protein [Camellia lanceoleosa]|nr:UPF0481 protein [Camellia lanceoleosa]